MTRKRIKVIAMILLVVLVLTWVVLGILSGETFDVDPWAGTTSAYAQGTEQEFYLPIVFQKGYEVDWFMAPTHYLCWGDYQWITLYEEPEILEKWYLSDCKECPKTTLYVFMYEGKEWWGNTTGVNEDN